MRKVTAVATAFAVLFGGCAHLYDPPVMSPTDGNQYAGDLAECRDHAERRHPTLELAIETLIQALITAAAAASVAWSGSQGNGDTAEAAALVGAGLGLAAGTQGGWTRQRAAVDQCMRDRGYTVRRASAPSGDTPSSLMSLMPRVRR